MHALLPRWRPDAESARRLYGLSEALPAADVIKAVEQVLHQRTGSTQMPPWLLALDGFAWARRADEPAQWFSAASERELLLQLVQQMDQAQSVAVFAQAAELARRLRLRCLIQGLAPAFSARWAEQLRDGEHWQPAGVDTAAADQVLSLCGQHPCFEPWLEGPPSSDQLCAQAQALSALYEQGWM